MTGTDTAIAARVLFWRIDNFPPASTVLSVGEVKKLLRLIKVDEANCGAPLIFGSTMDCPR